MYRTEAEYSAKEQMMIVYFGFAGLRDLVSPMAMYNMMVSKAFLDNDQTVYAESLRRCVNYQQAGYRGTPEYDDLIQVTE